MELKDRLKKARKYAGLTQKEIESKVEGLKQSSYSELERGESKSSTKLVELATLFQVNPVWLATGDGEMLTKPQRELVQILEAGTVSVEGDNDNLVPIPIYDVYFCCGDGNGSCEFENIKGYRNLPPSFFRERNIKPEDFKLICAVNNSNHPYIKDGDEVGIVITDREIKDGEYYAILLDGDRMIKQVFREAGGSYRLSSFNKDYPDKVVTPEHSESLIIAGRQVYRAG